MGQKLVVQGKKMIVHKNTPADPLLIIPELEI